jgi:superfamily II DNA helicase RecQ
LNAKALESLVKGVGFGDGVTIMRTTIGRPELIIRISWIPKNSRGRASSLRFLFDNGRCANIETAFVFRETPKTVVFCDSKKEAYSAMQECQGWLQKCEEQRYSSKQAKDTIKIFHRDTTKFDKKAIITEFQQPGKDSLVRLIFATETLGLGVNMPDVRRVVLYGIPKEGEPAVRWQRGGRACRDGY